MPLFVYPNSIPTATAQQSTHNTQVVAVISRILANALNQSSIQSLIDASINATPLSIDNTDSPYTPSASGGEFILVDTTSAAVTVNLPTDANIDPGYKVKVVRIAGANNVTVAQNGNTINGAASDTTISSSYAPKLYTYLGSNNYLEE